MTNETLLNLNLTATQIANIEAALSTLETELTGLISLSAVEKRRVLKLGERRESFSRQVLRVISQSPQLIPATVPVSAAQAGLATLDQLRPVLVRLTRLCERAADTDFAVGGAIMSVALQSYSLLKVAGRSAGLRTVRDELSSTFSRPRLKRAKAEDQAA